VTRCVRCGVRTGVLVADFRSLVVSRHARVGISGDLSTATEVWLVLHGYGMLARGILHWFEGAERPGRVLVAPEGLSRFYNNLSDGKRVVGASWVTREDFENELDDQYQYLRQAVAEIVPPALPLQVHGFSQGVSAGARWCVRTDRAVSRLVCWAGAMPEDVTADELKRKLIHEPLHLVVGDQDKRVPPEQVEADAIRLRAGGVEVVVHRFAGGHNVDPGMLATLSS
jgi:predicted esterase